MSAAVLVYMDQIQGAVQRLVEDKQFKDADESIFFSRELERILPEIVEDVYPLLKARTHFPIDSSADPADTRVTWRRWTRVGQAKIISDYAADLPKVEVAAEENTTPIRSLGISFGWSIQEIRASAKLNRSLDSEKGRIAREEAMRKEDDIAYNGDATWGLPGFLTNTNTTEYTLPNDGAGASQTFASKTADQIARDVSALVKTPFNTSKGTFQPDTVIMPNTIWSLITTKRVPDTNLTIMQFLRNALPEISLWDFSHKLETAGAGSTTKIVAYWRNPDAVKMIVPVDYETFPAQAKGLRFEVPGHSRTGGVIIKRPLSVAWADGA